MLAPQQAIQYFELSRDAIIKWIINPAAIAQFGFLIVAFFLAYFVTKNFIPRLTRLLTPNQNTSNILTKVMNFFILLLPLLLPVLAYIFIGISEGITRSLFGAGDVIAFGKRAFMFLAAQIFITKIIYSPFLKTLGKYILLPISILFVFGILTPVIHYLDTANIKIGTINFSLLAIIRGIVFGIILFWLGRWSKEQTTQYIRAQKDMRVPTRELASKAVELSIFGGCFLLLMSIMGINLSTLAVLGGAIGVGLGFGLQKIASNFISGIILLLEGQATVGDYIELDGGESGVIIKMLSRATILETFDGKWIVVPNEDFITTRIINWSDAGSGNRYTVNFTVDYETDINKVPEIIKAAVATHPAVLTKPEKPDCELCSFGDSGVNFCVEFWVEGIDDGKNKYKSDVLFLIWNALKDNNIKIPYPHHVIEIKGALPKYD